MGSGLSNAREIGGNMTIKEYLKDHSERELVDVMLESIRLEPFDKSIKKKLSIAVLEKDFGITIEEEDYLAKAREYAGEYIELERMSPEEKSPAITEMIQSLRISTNYYEKAIKQLQEKK
jgi:hypothetical protein